GLPAGGPIGPVTGGPRDARRPGSCSISHPTTLTAAGRAARTAWRPEVDMVERARRHPVATFFVLAFGLTWLVWAPRAAADPRLLERRRALPVSLGLGLLWGLWHLPLFWTTGAALEGRPVALPFLALPALSVLYTWVFRHTRGSLLLAVLLHAASNLWGVALLPPAGQDTTPALLRIGAMWLLALGVTMATAPPHSASGWPRAEPNPGNPLTP